MQTFQGSRSQRWQRIAPRLIWLSVLTLTSLAAACAALGGRTPKTQDSTAANPAPEWLSHELGCDRTQMDYHWNHERFGSTTDTDSACVVLGRWGKPAFSSVYHFFDAGTNADIELAQLELDWRTGPSSGNAHIRAYKSSPGYGRPTSDYFRIDRTIQAAVTPDTSHTGVVAGSVFDTLGYELRRPVQVCAQRYNATKSTFKTLGCTTTSLAGTFRLDSLPLGAVGLRVVCQAPRLFGKQIPQTFTADAARKPGTIVILMNTAGCDERPLRTVSRTFRGIWNSGFEMSDFSPCAADSWSLASDTIGVGNRDEGAGAWVTSLPDRKGKLWPRVKPGAARAIPGGYSSYVEWHGTVTGPGHYGHLGVAAFKIEVDSVIKMRAPSANDCK
jgi:hypothetical protein